MTSANDSVIICDSPCPTSGKKKNPIASARKRSRSIGLPRTVLTRNLAKKGFSNVSGELLPPSKRQKTDSPNGGEKRNMDQSVVILDESKVDSWVVDVGRESNNNAGVQGSSRGAVRSASKSAKKTKSAAKRKSFGVKATTLVNVAGKRVRRQLNKELKKTVEVALNRRRSNRLKARKDAVNDENLAENPESSVNATEDTDDIEVVWESTADDNAVKEVPVVEIPTDEVPTVENPIIDDPVQILTQPKLAALLKQRSKTKRKRLGAKEKRLKIRKDQSGLLVHTAPPRRNPVVNHAEGCSRLREIVIDGPNVAMGHTHGQNFSENGLRIVIDYFRQRGHVVTAFVPQYMRARDRNLLEALHKSGYVVFTPSRKIGGRQITPYDDRFIVEYATKCKGIIISSDQYRDLWHEKPQWRDTIENRLLTPTFVGDYLMFPEDPLGRRGPSLDEFLRF